MATINDKFLCKSGYAHLCFDALVTQEERVLSELSALRSDILSKRFLKIKGVSAGFEQTKRRVWSAAVQDVMVRVAYHQTASGVVYVEMQAEHAARRRERQLANQLAAIDKLWADRAAVLEGGQRSRKHTSVEPAHHQPQRARNAR